MKKRRSTVYVRPGKDVTLYVPVETPPEVVDYMNELKQEGMFSQGIIDILSEYVQRQGRSPQPATEVLDGQALDNRVVHEDPAITVDHGVVHEDPVSAVDPEVSDSGVLERAVSGNVASIPATVPEPTLAQTAKAVELADSGKQQASPKLNLAQIFQQAQRNSGKLME